MGSIRVTRRLSKTLAKTRKELEMAQQRLASYQEEMVLSDREYTDRIAALEAKIQRLDDDKADQVEEMKKMEIKRSEIEAELQRYSFSVKR